MSDFFNTGGTPMATSVPPELKLLIRIIMRTFYGFELYLCMDLLLAYPCIKEEDLAEILRLEAKQVHQHLVNLKKEKFVNERPIMETSGDGKQKSHSYYFINYNMVVNVVKYKLDKMRIQIETEEKQSTTRAIFKCSECRKTFSDLETKEIFFTMRCDHCGGEVEEDASSLPSRSSRNLLAKMNTQLKVVFDLLEKLEHVRLADDILRPEPMDMTPVLERIGSSSAAGQGSDNGAQRGDKLTNQAAGAKYDGMNGIKWSDRTSKQDLFSQTRVSINFDTSDTSQTANARPIKELPSIILANQTTDESINHMESHERVLNRDSLLLNNIKKAANDTLYNSSGMHASPLAGAKPAQVTNESLSGSAKSVKSSSPVLSGVSLETLILQKLLIHEKKPNGESNGHDSLNRTTSFAAISRKRDFDTLKMNRSESNLLDELDSLGFKKRRLNDGDGIFEARSYSGEFKHNYHHYSNQKSFSDGSDRDTDEDFERATSDPDSNFMDDDQASSDTMSSNELQVDNDHMPMVFVQSKPFRLDRVTPKFINMMTEKEKDYYISICRRLYTELYD